MILYFILVNGGKVQLFLSLLSLRIREGEILISIPYTCLPEMHSSSFPAYNMQNSRLGNTFHKDLISYNYTVLFDLYKILDYILPSPISHPKLLGVFFPTSPFISIIFMTSHGWFLSHIKNWIDKKFTYGWNFLRVILYLYIYHYISQDPYQSIQPWNTHTNTQTLKH